MDIREIIKRDEYKFIHQNKHLGKNIMFLTLGGSHAYGTNIETSDIDVRGCTLNKPNEIIGLDNFEQFINKETDTTIYAFNKLVKLLINCNPNTIELLGCREYDMVSDLGRKFLDNKQIFLSQKAMGSFKGYANSQLRRGLNACARDRVSSTEKEEHIKNSIIHSMHTLKDRYKEFDEELINLNVVKLMERELDEEICLDINLKNYPLRDFKGMISEMTSIVNSYDKLNHRNNKKEDGKINKHFAHLVRLHLMCYDILSKHEINTYRENDLDLLMSIRNGDYMNADGTYKDSFFTLVDKLEEKVNSAYRDTTLPKIPNMKLIQKLVMDINYESINRQMLI